MPSRSHFFLCRAACCLLFLATSARAETLQITSNPSGATVEIDGVTVGTTPFEKDFPGGYFHKPRTSLGSRLEHPMIARVTLDGYATKELQLTLGPMEWISLNGRHHGEYWLLKSNHFHAELSSIPQTFTGDITAKLSADSPVTPQTELSLEELTARAKPAVIYLKSSDKSGTGFLITGTGVIATNAHLARGQESLLATLSTGDQREAQVVYVDADLDLALAKIDAAGLPHLSLADAATVRQGEPVLAIGNPGDAMLFSVTKGIVSAVGKFPNAGPGTWIQTDAPINPGNSGGPLLNARAEVIGITTQKLIKKGVTGIGFALSSSDLLHVLYRFYPNLAVATSPTSAAAAPPSPNLPAESAGASAIAPSPPEATGTVSITSDPDGAEIFIDERFFGNTPATLKIPVGSHAISLKFPGRADWLRTLEISKGSKSSLKATFESLGP